MDMHEIAKKLISDENTEELSNYISDLKDSLDKSNKQFITLQYSFISSVILYYLIVKLGWHASVKGIKINDISIFDQYFLILPAGIFLVLSAVGYLRKAQRELYDWLMIQKFNISGETGVHELRIGSDFILALFVFQEFNHTLGKILVKIVSFLLSYIFIVLPISYIVMEAIENLKQFNYSTGTIFVCCIVCISYFIGFIIIFSSSKIK